MASIHTLFSVQWLQLQRPKTCGSSRVQVGNRCPPLPFLLNSNSGSIWPLNMEKNFKIAQSKGKWAVPSTGSTEVREKQEREYLFSYAF